MKVLEVKNNLVKISYNVNDNLQLSGFVIIEDSNTPYVAQVMNLKADADDNFAIVKLLFTFDSEGILKNYNGTIPSTKATVSKIPSNELLDIIPIDKPLVLGNLAQQGIRLKVDKSILENNLLICSNNISNTEDLLVCLTSQIDDAKTVIIDSEGQLRIDEKIVFGKDFKLPLNSDTIDYIYENDLENVDSINKAVIQDVLIEVQNYVKTLPEKFIPFDKFINVIDSQYRETQIPELILLKNKLLKYKDLNVFAQNIKEIYDLSIKIDNTDITVIDISTVPEDIQKEVIRYIYTALNEIESKVYAFCKVNNSNITKRLLKRFIAKDNVYTTIICPHEFKYIEEVKEFSQNIIFFTPSTLTHDFASYNTYLNKLNNNEFVIYGAHTQNIPMIVEVVDDITEELKPAEEENSSESQELDEQSNYQEEDFKDIFGDTQVENPEPEEVQTQVENENLEIVEEVEDQQTQEPQIDIIEDDFEPLTTVQEDETVSEVSSEIETSEDENLNFLTDETEIVDEPVAEEQTEELEEEYIPSDEAFEQPLNTDENVEFNSEQQDYEDNVEIVEPLADNSSHEELVEQVAHDVERSFYEKLPSEDEEYETVQQNDELTEDDLNLIEDLAVEDDIPLAGGDTYDDLPVEEVETPPVVPIYPADDIEERDGQVFMPGDRVVTEKYGEGVVEKMIKYGNKMLCSIDFPEIGRRLLDPNMTDIKKI